MEFRSFLNTDSPGIVDVWRKQPAFSRLSKTVSRNDLDMLVFGKPYFDPKGLKVAVDGGEIVGFAHAGFSPTRDQNDLDVENGVLCQLRYLPDRSPDQVIKGLLDASLNYLTEQGSKRCFAASQFPHVPFYMGLYGGSRIPGVVADDHMMLRALTDYGFQERETIRIFNCQLASFRAPVDRQQMSVRRQYQVSAVVDPMPTTWWNNCTFGMSETFAFRLYDKKTQVLVGNVDFWEIQPLSNEWGFRTFGMCDLRILEDHHKKGLGTFLVGQALTKLMHQGVSVCEVQVRESNESSIRVFEKIGFEQVAQGTELILELPESA